MIIPMGIPKTRCFNEAVKMLDRPPVTRSPKEQLDWQKTGSVRKAHFYGAGIALRDAMACPEFPIDRGIVIPAGGPYLLGAYVTIHMIREFGCDLPIQIWYLGRKNEMSDAQIELFNSLGVHCVNADAVAEVVPRKPRILNGFELKGFAVAYSPFRQVMMIDADCYPVANVWLLFECEAFQRTGATFFPDLEFTNKWTNWHHWLVAPYPPDCGWETGQYIIDKSRHWDVINLMRYYDDHSDFYYGAGKISDHGDKGSWRVGFAYLKREVNFYHTIPEWVHLAFVHTDRDGNPIFIHRCKDKFRKPATRFTTTTQKNRANVKVGNIPGEDIAFGYYHAAMQIDVL